MGLSDEEIRSWRDKLDREKEKIAGRKKFPSEVSRELDALENELVEYGYDPEFSGEILREVAATLVSCDGNDRLRLRCARSIIKGVKSGDQMEMLLVVARIGVHFATMNLLELMNAAKTLEERVGYGNLCNKFARTSISQTESLQRLRSGPDPKLLVNHLSVNQGGQAIVGNVTHNAADKVQLGITESPRLVTDQPSTAMPIFESDDQAVATAPLVEPDHELDPKATGRKRRK